jgi:hypothetical protein
MSDREKEAEGEKPDEAEASTDSEKDEAEKPEDDATSSEASASDGPDSDSTPSDGKDSDEDGGDDDEDGGDDDGGDDDGGDDDGEEEGSKNARAPSESRSSTTSLLIGVLCLAAGFGIGWFGHDFQSKKAVKEADAAVEGKGDAARGPCKDWEEALCGGLGATAYACSQAKAASALLSGSACEQAQQGVLAKIEEIKAERAQCTELSDKLCGELGADGQACELVKTQTPSFPPERCEQMMQNYDQVLAQLKMMQERGAIPGQGPPGHPGMNRGGPPPGVARPPATWEQPPTTPSAAQAPPPAPAPTAP